ncbi:MAG: prepilin-type N-terminal cleavage/methylation domain-containing protein, partial [Alphaproteobacteria bacterium]|nr:prepilin-type N-terminal cleavage/methylation domain-containing protein [Alphaproteobacteria bacterium]
MAGRQAGFSLVEMSIVLAILGLIVGGGVGIGSSFYSKSKVAEARVMMDRVERALRDYAAAFRALPCPDVNGDGVADGTTTCTGNQANGVLPWATLGLRREEALDPWKHYLTYRVPDGASGFTATGTLDMSACSTTATSYATAITSCSNSVNPNDWLLGRGLVVQDPSGASTVTVNDPTTRFTGAAYFLASHGESGVGGITAGLTAHSGTLSAHETPNAASLALDNATGAPTGQTGFVSRKYGSGGSGGRFDDLVRHPDIMSFAVAAGLGPRDVIAARKGLDKDALTADGTVTGTDTTPAVVTPTTPTAPTANTCTSSGCALGLGALLNETTKDKGKATCGDSGGTWTGDSCTSGSSFAVKKGKSDTAQAQYTFDGGKQVTIEGSGGNSGYLTNDPTKGVGIQTGNGNTSSTVDSGEAVKFKFNDKFTSFAVTLTDTTVGMTATLSFDTGASMTLTACGTTSTWYSIDPTGGS